MDVTFWVLALLAAFLVGMGKGGLPVVHAFYQSLGIRFLKLYLDADGEATAGLVATGIPLTLHRARIQPGERLLLVGSGAGTHFGALLVQN